MNSDCLTNTISYRNVWNDFSPSPVCLKNAPCTVKKTAAYLEACFLDKGQQPLHEVMLPANSLSQQCLHMHS